MQSLQTAEPRFSFRLGLMLVMFLPANIVILFSAGAYLVDNDLAYLQSLWLIGVTALIAALPILAHMAMGTRADTAMPAIREWMSRNSWLISIVVYLFFIYAMVS